MKLCGMTAPLSRQGKCNDALEGNKKLFDLKGFPFLH